MNNMFVFNKIYYHEAYKDHPKMDYNLYKLLNFESNVTIEF